MIDDESEYLNQLIISVRKSSLSAKGIKDIKHNLINFLSTIDNFIHNQYNRLIDKQTRFYNEFLTYVYDNIEQKKPSERDLSSLFNTYREVYDSNKALIIALENIAIFGNIGLQFKQSKLE